MVTPKLWQDIRSTCGRARIQFDPSWCKSAPYCTFIEGTAGPIYTSLNNALNYMQGKGYKFTNLDWK